MTPEQFQKILDTIYASNQKDALYYAAAVIQILLGGVVLWYTVETRKLRTQNEKQVELQRKQMMTSNYPDIVLFKHFGINYPYASMVKKIRDLYGDHFPFEDEDFLLDKDGYINLNLFTVKNTSSYTASDIHLAFYDYKSGKYFLGFEYIGSLQGEAENDISIFSAPHTLAMVLEIFKKHFSIVPHEEFETLFATADESFLAAVYRNSDSTLYYSKQFFRGDNFNLSHNARKIIWSPYNI